MDSNLFLFNMTFVSQINEKFHLTNWEIVSVNPVDKNWNWRDYFCFWANNVQSLISFSLIASLYIIYNLKFFCRFIWYIFSFLINLFFFKFDWTTIPKTRNTLCSIFKNSAGHKWSKIFWNDRGSSWNIFLWCTNIFYF